jgi:prepilin-type processing-associated H-X9-DG protein
VDRVRICSADPKGPARLAAQGTSYIMNEWTSVDEVDPFGNLVSSMRKVDALPRPSDTITVFECANAMAPTIFNDHTHSRNWFNWAAVIVDIQPDRHRIGGTAGDHSSGVANYLFGDAHVEKLQAAPLKARIDAGDNFSKPPQ